MGVAAVNHDVVVAWTTIRGEEDHELHAVPWYCQNPLKVCESKKFGTLTH